MEYAKLMDGSIFFAPQVIVHDTQRIYNPPAELLTLHGFKPVQFTEPHTCCRSTTDHRSPYHRPE